MLALPLSLVFLLAADGGVADPCSALQARDKLLSHHPESDLYTRAHAALVDCRARAEEEEQHARFIEAGRRSAEFNGEVRRQLAAADAGEQACAVLEKWASRPELDSDLNSQWSRCQRDREAEMKAAHATQVEQWVDNPDRLRMVVSAQICASTRDRVAGLAVQVREQKIAAAGGAVDMEAVAGAQALVRRALLREERAKTFLSDRSLTEKPCTDPEIKIVLPCLAETTGPEVRSHCDKDPGDTAYDVRKQLGLDD